MKQITRIAGLILIMAPIADALHFGGLVGLIQGVGAFLATMEFDN